MANDLIAQARKRYLSAHPLRITDVPAVTATGEPMPGSAIKIPNLGDIQIIGCKLGMEFLAICHDDDAVEEWINTALGIVKDPDLAAVLFANVFRGFNLVIAAMADRPGVREHLERQAVEAWNKDFGE